MNAKELVIKGADKVVAYACARCRQVFRDSFQAERCCPNYVCRYCGAVTDPWHLACDACGDLARVQKARRVSPAEYGIAMVCVDDDGYLATEDVETAVEGGSFHVDYNTVVVLDAERLDALLREFEFRAAMLGEI